MKNVGNKPETLRTAIATAEFMAPKHCLAMVASGESEKGNPAATARVAGILAAKRTDEILPLCHPLPLHGSEVTFEVRETDVLVTAEVSTIGPTGVEMEALTAASVAALTLYDMLKPYAEPEELALKSARLSSKAGGKTHFKRTLARTQSAAVIVCPNHSNGPNTISAYVVEFLRKAGFDSIQALEVAEQPGALSNALDEQIAAGTAFVVTIGGTGIEHDDNTVEIVAPLITTAMPGLMEAARAYGQRRTPYAAASRGVAGFTKNSLLLTLPGSQAGAEETLDALLPSLVHIFNIRSRPQSV